MRTRTGNRAFSLAELLVGMVVAAIVILMLSSMGTIATRSYKDLQDQSSLESDAQFAIDSIRSAVRQSATDPTLSGTTLIIDSNQRFEFDGANLSYVTVSPSSSVRVLSGVSAFSFSLPMPSGDLVTVGLNYTKAGQAHNYSVQAERRNP